MVAIATPIKAEIAGGRLAAGSARDKINVADGERWLSLAGGAVLGIYGLRRGGLAGAGLAVTGGALLHRALSGHCALYHALGLSTKQHGRAAAVGAGRGVKLVRTVTIQRPAEQLYEFWRNFENLPQVMSHLVSVRIEGDRSHWIARAPAGSAVEWDAEVMNDQPGRLIAWRSLSGSQIATAGSVHFEPLANDRGTVLRVTLKIDPPGGALGSWLAWAFGADPGQQIREDLRRFKQIMETGEVPLVEGQPSGRKGARA